MTNVTPGVHGLRGLRLPWGAGGTSRLILIALPLILVLAGGMFLLLKARSGRDSLPVADAHRACEVDLWDSPFDNSGHRTSGLYEMLPSASKPWRITVFFPHMKDSYWLAVDYGLVEEARRLGVRLHIQHAGGYENLPVQIAQMRQCIQTREADAIILAAISYDGLNGVIAEAKARGIPVVDSVNGVSSHDIGAKSLITFDDMARKAGEYLARKHPAGSPPVRIAWFPGPSGAGWVIAGDRAFKRALEGSSAEIVATLYGDTGLKSQRELIKNALNVYPNLDYIAGTAVSAEVAPGVLRSYGLDSRINVISTYLTPGVYRHLRRGNVMAAMSDAPVDLGRLALDQAVGLLEKKPFPFHVEPPMRLLEPVSVDSFDRSHALAPDGFEPVFAVNATFSTEGSGK
jgi:protein TorT